MFISHFRLKYFFLFKGTVNLKTDGRGGRFGTIQTFTGPPAIASKPGELGEEHIPTIMETIQEHIMVERERLERGSSD